MDNGEEIALFTVSSNTIIISRDGFPIEQVEIDKKVVEKDGELYTTEDGIEKAFNIIFEYAEDTKTINIYTLDYLVTAYLQQYKLDEKNGPETISDKKAILEGLLIYQTDDSNKKYGVMNVSTGKNVLEAKYDLISYFPYSSQFLVESNGKYGMTDASGKIKLKVAYDEIRICDNELGLYLVKENNLYGIPVSFVNNTGEEITPVANNLIVDSYNGKEYETILGSDGKMYDLKEEIEYPEEFENKDIESIGNNLETEEKEVEVKYKNGDIVKFNYQTGEIIKTSKTENKQNLLEYIGDKLTEIGEEKTKVESISTKYEESKELENKLEDLPIEEAIQKNSTETNENRNDVSEKNENEESNNSEKEKKYISIYNEEKGEYQIYNEAELLDAEKEEVESENEKIEANNLKEYYAKGLESKDEKQGIVWIVISIIGVGIVLLILRKNLKKKR